MAFPIFSRDLEGGTESRPALSPQMISQRLSGMAIPKVRRKLRKSGYFGDL